MAAPYWRATAQPSRRWRRPTASTAISSPPSGESSPITAGTSASAPSFVRPPRSPASAGGRIISARSCLSALEILARGDVRPDHLKGSWAGAFGPTQFMPTAFKRYAVDFDGDGRRDVVDSVPDLIASTANNLKKDGWVSGQTWGYEVVLPNGFNYLYADRSRALSVREWQQAGIKRAGNKTFPRPDDRAFLLVPAGAQGPAFLMLANFRVIMKYNPAEAYALAIGYFADRLRGGEPFVQPWPRHERVLTRAERFELQALLARRGYEVGEPDGHLGGRTRNALRAFQSAVGRVPDGFASASVLERLRSW
jgi:membrane-bound lytic murein transglycosylase B